MLRLRTMLWGCATVLAFASIANAALIQVDYSGATAVGLVNTMAGGNGTVAMPTDSGAGYYYAAGWESDSANEAIDGNTSTKLCISNNFSATGSGLNTGLYITLAQATRVTALQFSTANDSTERDPKSITIEGSNATGDDLLTGSNWTSIASSLNAGLDTDPGRCAAGSTVEFTNATAFKSYRILVTDQRDGSSANCMQISEVKLFTIPEPSTLLMSMLGIIGLLAYAWRRRK